MAVEIAEAVVGALKGELAATAVNAPMVPAEVEALSFEIFSHSYVSYFHDHLNVYLKYYLVLFLLITLPFVVVCFPKW